MRIFSSFRDARIRTQLGLAFGLMVLLMAVASGFGGFKLNQTNAVLQNLAAHEWQLSQLASAWKSSATINSLRAATLARLGAGDFSDQLKRETSVTDTEVAKSILQIEALANDDE